MLFGIVLIPIAILLAAKFVLKWDITWLEWGVSVVLSLLVLALIWYGGRTAAAGDREVWNGAVVSKDVDYYTCPTNTSNPCQNGYSCNCYTICTSSTDSKGNVTQSCTTHCDTCYRYPWEQDWQVKTTLGQYTISRVDAQGASEPPRWTRTEPGDPVADLRPYKNWVKASSGTLFRDSATAAERFARILPRYPETIFDYYRIDRVVTPNVRLPNEAQWNLELGRMLATVGPKRQVNMVLVVVDAPRDYARALRYHWQGFKKNDAIVIVGVSGGVVRWAEVMSWSKNPGFDIKARQLIEAYQGQPIAALDPPAVSQALGGIAMSDFQRRPMEEFEYLKGDIPPPGWLIWLAVIAAIVLGVGSAVMFHQNDLDGALFNRNKRYRW